MKASDVPAKFPIPFASSAGGAYVRAIPQASQIGIQDGAASLTDGFPPDTFILQSAGGVGPFGQDMNGILKEITLWSQWQSAAGPIVYDSTFSAAIGGYPKGTILAAALDGQFWLSTADDNTSDPDTGGANWARLTMATPMVSFVNLAGSATGSNRLASWTVDQITAATALGGVPYFGSGLTLNFDGATVGAGGMDTGSIPAAGDLYVYAIFKPSTSTWSTLGTTAGNGATLYGGANMPAGYTASVLIWSGKTAASNIVAFVQLGRRIAYSITGVSGLSHSGFVALAISSQVPYNAKSVSGTFTQSGTGGVTIASTITGLGNLGVTSAIQSAYDLALPTPQTIYYETTGAATLAFTFSGYTI